jgi:cytosine/adenosine deaminase-related metal-dependent hydrolase
MSSLLIKDALLVATMDDADTRIEGGSVYVEGPEIIEVSPHIDREADRTIDARGKVVLPGLVNTHHHLYQTLNRNLPRVQDVELFDWLTCLYEVWRELTPDAVRTSALVGLGELLLTGCTLSADQYYVFPEKQAPDLIDREIEAARTIGIRFQPCRGGMSRGKCKGGLPPDDVVQSEDVILKDCERVIDRFHDPSRFSMCRVALAPCSPFSVTTELLKETAALARSRGVRIHTHLCETLDEEKFCQELHGMRPMDYMEDVGWLGPDVWFAHAVWMNPEEIERLAESGTGVAHCPTSNLRLGSGIAPIPAMLDAGIPVGLAVDGSASNDSSDMLGEIRQAMLVHRVKSGITSMPAERALWMGTRGGARIMGWEDEVGSIEAGKAADMAIFDLRHLGYAGALHDPVAALIFSGDSHLAHTVIVNGEIVVEQGRLTRIDEDRIYHEANRIAREMVERASRKTGIDYYRKPAT